MMRKSSMKNGNTLEVKKWMLLLMMMITFVSCKKSVLEKPDNLIEEEMMVDIFYDLSIIEAIKSNDPIALDKYGINPSTFIYQKYKIDSIQLAKSDRYYAVDVDKYRKIFDEVNKRLADQKKALTPNGSKPILLDSKKR